MKQLLLIVFTLVLFANANSQVSQLYIIEGEGNEKPITTITEGPEGIAITLNLESFSTQSVPMTEGEAERVIFPGGVNVTIKGQPDIQHIATGIAIPSFGKTELTIVESEYTDFPNFNIAPSAGDPGIYDNEPEKYIPDTAIYSHSAFFPASIVTADDPYIWASTRGQVIRFYPVQYNPAEKILRVYHYIKATLKTLNEAGINEVTRLSAFSESGTPVNMMSRQYFTNSIESSRYAVIEEQGNMLIIAHPDFIESMKPFIEWKNQKGIRCEIVDVNTIGDAAKIKDYVSEYYYSKGLTYLLLVGDAAFVPSNVATKGASDNMYGYITGNDHYPEILVGRFSCETADQCRIMVERTLTYEKNPAENASFDNFLGIGSGLGPGDDGEMDFEHIRNIGTTLNSNTYHRVNELYDGSRGGNDQNGNPTATMTADAINKGQGAIMYIGHGSVNSWLTSEFSTTDARELTNTATHPFIWSAGCNNGDFTDITCLAESFLRAESNGNPTGAVAALMSSASQSWYPPMEAQDEIALLLNENAIRSSSSTFGGLSLNGCMKMNDKYGDGAFLVTDTWILFGDPSVELRTAKPLSYNPVHDTLIGTDSKSVTISGIDSTAFACISSKGHIIATLKSTGNQIAMNLPDLNGLESLTLTLTGKNHKPYIAQINITELPAIAVNPTPGNHTRLVSSKPVFTWILSQGCIPEYYTVSIRQTSDDLWDTYRVTSSDSLVIPNLDYNTDYEWKVISHNNFGISESPIFNFTTIHPPDEDFEQEGFPRNNWENTYNWYVDNSEAYEGNYSLHSGNIVNRENSSLYFECETMTCDFISFCLKLNAENPNTNISFFMDSTLIADWNSSTPWTKVTYRVEPGTHRFEWRFTDLKDSISPASAAWIDNIYLPVNMPVSIQSDYQDACASDAIALETTVNNYASLKWETTGTGHFDDATRMNAVYFPSTDDQANSEIWLNLMVASNSTCEAKVFPYRIAIAAMPELMQIRDTTLYLNESFTIEPVNGYANQYLLYGSDTIPYPLEIDVVKLVPGANTITLVSENSLGCSQTLQFNITLINQNKPSMQVLTVYPNPANEMINLYNPSGNEQAMISIFSIDGQLIEQHEFNSMLHHALSVNHLNPGVYIVRYEYNGNALTTKFVKI